MKTWSVLFLLAFSISSVLSQANATIPRGKFHGKLINRAGDQVGEVNIYIKAVRRNEESGIVNYGLVMKRIGGQPGIGMSLYRIEERPNGSQAWIQLYQKSSLTIGADDFNRATFQGQAALDDGELMLRLSPTEFGNSMQCYHEIIAKREDHNPEWTRLQFNRSFTFRGDQDTEVSIGTSPGNGLRSMTGRFKVENRIYSGSFLITTFIPGIIMIRRQSLNSDSASGIDLNPQIIAFAAPFYQRRPVLNNYFKLHFFDMNPTENSCSYRRTTMED